MTSIARVPSPLAPACNIRGASLDDDVRVLRCARATADTSYFPNTCNALHPTTLRRFDPANGQQTVDYEESLKPPPVLDRSIDVLRSGVVDQSSVSAYEEAWRVTHQELCKQVSSDTRRIIYEQRQLISVFALAALEVHPQEPRCFFLYFSDEFCAGNVTL